MLSQGARQGIPVSPNSVVKQTVAIAQLRAAVGAEMADVAAAQLDARVDALETGGSASGLSGVSVVTVQSRGSFEWTQQVVAAGVKSADVVVCQLAAGTDADENTADCLDLISLSAVPANNAITFSLVFSVPASGPIKINWKV